MTTGWSSNLAGKLTTHVLDTARGHPAVGLRFTLFRIGDDCSHNRTELARGTTDSDGRSPFPILEGDVFEAGVYALEFEVADYHRDTGQLPEQPFLGVVTLAFTVSDPSRHLHVPLLVSPFGYTTYRGS